MKEFTQAEKAQKAGHQSSTSSRPLIPVAIEHVQKSYEELYSSPVIQALRLLSKYAKLIVLACALETKKTNTPSAWFTNVRAFTCVGPNVMVFCVDLQQVQDNVE
jgi:hypothetical protein